MVYFMIYFEPTPAKFFWFFFFLWLNLTAFTYFGIMAINLTPAVQVCVRSYACVTESRDLYPLLSVPWIHIPCCWSNIIPQWHSLVNPLLPSPQFGTVFVSFFFTVWNFLCGFLMAQVWTEAWGVRLRLRL